MKALTRVAFYALAISVVPFSYSYAQDPVDLAPEMNDEEMVEIGQMDEDVDIQAMQDEMPDEGEESFEPPTMQQAKDALDALPGAKDAVKGEVPDVKDRKVYDIYGRQLAYREGAKEYRESIDKRREGFDKPRTKRIEDYKKTRDIIYAAESAEYQKKLNEENEEMFASEEVLKLPTGEALEAVLEEEAIEEIGLKEQKIPTDASARKKVVTAGDAPEFDSARLGMKPVVVENATPPPMPEAAPEEAPKEALEAAVPAEEQAVEAALEMLEEVAVEAQEVSVGKEKVAEEVVEELPEPVEEAEEALDADTEALLNGDDLENSFGDDEVENPFKDTEAPKYND